MVISLVGFTDRVRSVYYAITVTVFLTLNNVLKISYADPRPFWSSDDVQAYHCSAEYGNPSGHAMISTGMAMLVALDYVEDFVADGSNQRLTIFASSLIFGATTSYSRLFLGVHGINQVVFGSAIGLWVAFTMHYVFRSKIMGHLNSIISLEDTRYLEWLSFVTAFMVFFFASLVLYTGSIEESNLPEWSTRILAKCGSEKLEKAFTNYSILSLGNQVIGFSSYLGFVYSVKQAPDLASEVTNLRLSQRLAWFLTWLVTAIPVLVFSLLFDTSGYSQLV